MLSRYNQETIFIECKDIENLKFGDTDSWKTAGSSVWNRRKLNITSLPIAREHAKIEAVANARQSLEMRMREKSSA